MSSGEFETPTVKGKWHFPAIYAGISLIISAILYFGAPAFIAWMAIQNNSTFTYEDQHRKFAVTPAQRQPQATPQVTSSPAQPEARPELAQNAPKPEAQIEEQEKSAAPEEMAPTTEEKLSGGAAPVLGVPKTGPGQQNQKPRAKQIAFRGPLSLLPTMRSNGRITIEQPLSWGDRWTDEPSIKSSYARDNLLWILQSYKCQHYGDAPMYEACYIAPKGPKKRPVVRAW